MEAQYENFIGNFSNILTNLTENKIFSDIIFLCIGTDRITGDTFGPLTGYKLNNLYSENRKIKVIGDFNQLVCSSNIEEIIFQIKENFQNPFIVAIDSAVSRENEIGTIITTEGGINLAAGINRKIAYIGDMSIKGVVGINYNNPRLNMKILETTRLGLVMNMADIVSRGIYEVLEVI